MGSTAWGGGELWDECLVSVAAGGEGGWGEREGLAAPGGVPWPERGSSDDTGGREPRGEFEDVEIPGAEEPRGKRGGLTATGVVEPREGVLEVRAGGEDVR